MPSLVVQHQGRVWGGVLNGPVIIGRRSESDVALTDPMVSRLHAWIGKDDGHYFVQDAGSRTGTFVNGVRIGQRWPLEDADQIAIGPAALTFHADDALPAIVSPVTFHGSETRIGEDGQFIFFCVCGIPLLVHHSYAGRLARCNSCQQMLRIPPPELPTDLAPPLPPPQREAQPSSVQLCGACHCSIETGDQTTSCPACGLPFHADCWRENFGCSAYGCSKVNSLRQGPDIRIDAAPHGGGTRLPPLGLPQTPGPSPAASDMAMPWEFVFLGLSAVALLIGLAPHSYGVPCVLAGAGIGTYTYRRPQKPVLLFVSIGICVAGLILGIFASITVWSN